MYEVEIHEEADQELQAIAVFYESKKAGLGEAFLTELARTFETIAAYPHSSAAFYDEYRRSNMNKFPYGVVYRAEGEKVTVYAVAHFRRRPDYWKKRRRWS